ncbi:MAG: hypothetical protein NVS4B3_13330 [Gemmatimonadaceae bacterium]
MTGVTGPVRQPAHRTASDTPAPVVRHPPDCCRSGPEFPHFESDHGMATQKLDGAGMAKMETLDSALTMLQRLHGLVEQYGLAVKRNQSVSVYGIQIRRVLTPLVGSLKGQFGFIADQAAGLNLVATRGGSDQTKLRSLREGVASLRTQLELQVNKVKANHMTEADEEAD